MVTLFFFLKNNVTEIFFFILKERKGMYNVDFFLLKRSIKNVGDGSRICIGTIQLCFESERNLAAKLFITMRHLNGYSEFYIHVPVINVNYLTICN